jgi:hypothetical protein
MTIFVTFDLNMPKNVKTVLINSKSLQQPKNLFKVVLAINYKFDQRGQKMKIAELKQLLPILFKHRITPFIHGGQGKGKTQTIKQVANELGLGFVHLHLATQEVGDLVGLLVHGKDGTVKHARPEWFPTANEGILFLDELNRAHPDVLQAMFSLITEGTIHTHKLPEGWHIVAAGNYNSNQFNVTDTSDAAWLSRFCHIDFQPSKEEFVTFAEYRNAETVADFIRTHGELLEQAQTHKDTFDSITPNRRAWLEMIAPLESEESIEQFRYEVYSGIVGKTAATTFMTHKIHNEKRLSAKDVLNNYPKVSKKVQKMFEGNENRFDIVNSTVEEILTYLEGKNVSNVYVENFKAFLLDIPLELGLKVIKRLSNLNWSQKNEILNSAEFVNQFKNVKLTKNLTFNEKKVKTK